MVFAAAGLLEVAGYYVDYFTAYKSRAHAWFNDGMPEVVEKALQLKREGLYYTSATFRDENLLIVHPHTHFLFLGGMDPEIYRKSGLEGFGIYRYQSGQRLPRGSIFLTKDVDEILTPSSVLAFINNPDPPPAQSVLVAEIRIPVEASSPPKSSRNPVYQIFRVP